MTTPSIYALHQRLFSLGATERDPTVGPPLSADEAEQAIRDFLASEAMCLRATVDGKERGLKFREYWERCYQRKWALDGRALKKKGEAA